MGCEDIIKEILRNHKLQLGINEDIKVKIRNYKTRAALSNLKTKTIYINKNLLCLGEDVIGYLILHELLHIKLNSKYHSDAFYKTLYESISPEKIMRLKMKIREKLIQVQISNVKQANFSNIFMNLSSTIVLNSYT
jgi:predicted metal-dependent hydrolase